MMGPGRATRAFAFDWLGWASCFVGIGGKVSGCEGSVIGVLYWVAGLGLLR